MICGSGDCARLAPPCRMSRSSWTRGAPVASVPSMWTTFQPSPDCSTDCDQLVARGGVEVETFELARFCEVDLEPLRQAAVGAGVMGVGPAGGLADGGGGVAVDRLRSGVGGEGGLGGGDGARVAGEVARAGG